jgi:hypothetical protein
VPPADPPAGRRAALTWDRQIRGSRRPTSARHARASRMTRPNHDGDAGREAGRALAEGRYAPGSKRSNAAAPIHRAGARFGYAVAGLIGSAEAAQPLVQAATMPLWFISGVLIPPRSSAPCCVRSERSSPSPTSPAACTSHRSAPPSVVPSPRPTCSCSRPGASARSLSPAGGSAGCPAPPRPEPPAFCAGRSTGRWHPGAGHRGSLSGAGPRPVWTRARARCDRVSCWAS